MRKADNSGSVIVFTTSGHPGALFYKFGFSMCQIPFFQGRLTITNDSEGGCPVLQGLLLGYRIIALPHTCERVGFPGSWLEWNRDDSMS